MPINGVNRIAVSEMSKPKAPKGSVLKSALDAKPFAKKLLGVKGNEKLASKK